MCVIIYVYAYAHTNCMRVIMHVYAYAHTFMCTYIFCALCVSLLDQWKVVFSFHMLFPSDFCKILALSWGFMQIL